MIDTEVARTFDRRSALFLTGGVAFTSFLILRMLQMQVFNYKEYTIFTADGPASFNLIWLESKD